MNKFYYWEVIMYDIIIVGGGPAGLTAALYAARANKKVLVLESNICGGQIVNAKDVQNYPGYKNISGSELSENMMLSFDARVVHDLVAQAPSQVLVTISERLS